MQVVDPTAPSSVSCPLSLLQTFVLSGDDGLDHTAFAGRGRSDASTAAKQEGRMEMAAMWIRIRRAMEDRGRRCPALHDRGWQAAHPHADKLPASAPGSIPAANLQQHHHARADVMSSSVSGTAAAAKQHIASGAAARGSSVESTRADGSPEIRDLNNRSAQYTTSPQVDRSMDGMHSAGIHEGLPVNHESPSTEQIGEVAESGITEEMNDIYQKGTMETTSRSRVPSTEERPAGGGNMTKPPAHEAENGDEEIGKHSLESLGEGLFAAADPEDLGFVPAELFEQVG